MPEYVWMCLNEQHSEYASGPKYVKILCQIYMPKWQGSQYASITQHYEYARICLDIVLNISWVLNMPGSEHKRVLKMQELHRVLNMSNISWEFLGTHKSYKRSTKRCLKFHCSGSLTQRTLFDGEGNLWTSLLETV